VFCPVCGEDAGDDERCPSCDADLTPFQSAEGVGAAGGQARDAGETEAASGGTSRGRTTGKSAAARGRSTSGSSNGASAAGGGSRTRAAAAKAKTKTSAASAPRSGLRRWLPWIVAGVVVVAAVVIVVLGPGGGDGTQAAQSGGGGGSDAATASVADTNGTYDQLVQRANGLYDQGITKFQAGDIAAAADYFSAAAEVYSAAWKKQPGDPNVGTDWATSLFYSGDIDAAIAQVDVVLAANPDFQPGYYNRGNYLEHRARLLTQEGDTAGAAEAKKQAEAAFRKAVALDPTSDVGKAAAERLKSVGGQ
jgi:hypothetical protein